jgi:Pyruvate/2-oxoacid:ferredoxin oxidoreductase delta subunit
MKIETAQATRHCHICREKILRGEDHIAKYEWSYGFKKRVNYCLGCALCKSSPQAKAAVEEYIKLHPENKNFILIKRIQLGVALR